MSSPCNVVAERVALGEPLGDVADHAASCARCRRLAALPTELGATRSEVDPGLGFSARMTAGAQHRLVVRKRQRVAATVAAAAAVTTLGVFALTREPEPQPIAETPRDHDLPAVENLSPDPWDTEREHDQAGDEDVRALVQLANTDRNRRLSAPWGRIQKSLQPYRVVIQGVEP